MIVISTGINSRGEIHLQHCEKLVAKCDKCSFALLFANVNCDTEMNGFQFCMVPSIIGSGVWWGRLGERTDGVRLMDMGGRRTLNCQDDAKFQLLTLSSKPLGLF